MEFPDNLINQWAVFHALRYFATPDNVQTESKIQGREFRWPEICRRCLIRNKIDI